MLFKFIAAFSSLAMKKIIDNARLKITASTVGGNDNDK
jgi:hypothetical protein